MKLVSPYGPRPPGRADRKFESGHLYLTWLGIVLLGYALLGRGFAYLGVPPLFVGEITLLLGAVMAWRLGLFRPLFKLGPVRLLLAFMLWSAICTIPHFSTYGMETARDAMLWIYALFALIVASILLSDPRHLREVLIKYRVFATVFIGLVGGLYLVSTYFAEVIPSIPWAPEVSLLEAKGGDIMVHIAGVTAFLIAGFMRQRWLLIVLLVIDLGLVVVANRGGMVAFMAAFALLLFLKPPQRSVGRLASAFVVMMLVAIMAGSAFTLHSGRQISVDQLVENVRSVMGSSTQGSLDGTREWRLEWWGKIVDYTFTGPYFFTGKGYGINLATDDGFQVKPGNRLRSPHNGHLTVLARSGVPGLALWTAMHVSWVMLMLGAWRRAREKKDWAWVSVFAFIVPYVLAMLVNATFDVYVEGPMGGIWLWSMWGLGLAAVHIHRETPEAITEPEAGRNRERERDVTSAAARPPAPPRRPHPAPAAIRLN